MHRILELLEKNSTLTVSDLAVMLDKSEEEISAAIEQFKKDGIIIGSKLLVDWQKTSREFVTAFIEVKVTPQFGKGFDQIAERFYQYEQVKTVYLMSGAYDLALIIEGKTLNEVALFVAEQLSPMDTVISTATHFVLKKYKQDGVLFEKPQDDERLVMMVCISASCLTRRLLNCRRPESGSSLILRLQWMTLSRWA